MIVFIQIRNLRNSETNRTSSFSYVWKRKEKYHHKKYIVATLTGYESCVTDAWLESSLNVSSGDGTKFFVSFDSSLSVPTFECNKLTLSLEKLLFMGFVMSFFFLITIKSGFGFFEGHSLFILLMIDFEML